MRFNTLFQLLALAEGRLAAARRARHLLFIPDLFHLFHRPPVNELTDASTSQMLDPATCSWADDLVKAFGLPARCWARWSSRARNWAGCGRGVAAETGCGRSR